VSFIDPLESILPLEIRIVLGLSVFLGLAIWDWRRYGAQSKRLREYAFIIAVIAATVVYAVIHDLITSTISPEYFTAGKGLAQDHLLLRAMWLATKAAVGPGALLGALFVFANNPSPHRAQLSHSQLSVYLLVPLLGAIVGAVTLGAMGYFDVRGLEADLIGSIEEPRRFITVWGIHWGTYLGAGVGLCVSLIQIRRHRQRQSPASQ